MKTLATVSFAFGAALTLAACETTPAPTAAPAAAPTAASPQQGFGYSQEDRFVTQRGGSSPAMQNPEAVGRDVSGITRRGTGRGSAGARVTGAQVRGSGDVEIQRQGAGAPRP